MNETYKTFYFSQIIVSNLIITINFVQKNHQLLSLKIYIYIFA